MTNLILVAGTCWTVGTMVTWIRLGRVSSDSPGIRFLLALVAWPFLIGRAGH